jgi:formiminoglutamase
VARPEDVFLRADDPRLGEVVEFWRGDPAALTPGRAVLVGFPHDEGVRRNHGRVGAADAPRAIRHALYRLTPWDGAHDVDLASHPPLDAGNVHALGTLEDTQGALGEVVWRILESGAVPVVLGGGHETAYGHYLGYVSALREVAILNLDAHLDVRPCPEGHGHSGSAFRQAMEHPALPLPASRYACLGAQPHSISREHVRFVQQGGGVVRWENEVRGSLLGHFAAEQQRLTRSGCPLYVTVDADVVSAAEVPGVSAPNALGLSGAEVAEFAYQAGLSAAVSSFDLVEINPRHDPDGRSTRWAATVVWHFLVGLAQRGGDRGTSKT